MRGLFLPLKFTQGIDLAKAFDNHISKKYSKEAIAQTHPTFEEMQKLRNSLDFNKMNAQLSNDFRLASEFELQIIQYLRYVYLVDNFFKNDFPDNKHLKVNFPWTDSFQPAKKFKVINHIKYELASCLYNLTVCYYMEGIHYAATPSTPEKLKGIAKIRNALWCINEVKQVLPTLLVNPADLPTDLNLSYINLLHNYFIGLTYATLGEVMGADPSKNTPDKMASINKAAAKHFQIAYDIIAQLKQSPLPEPITRSLKMNLLYNATMFRSETYFQMAQIHLKKVDEEILKGHMGFAVSYLRITKTDFDDILRRKTELDLLTPEQRTALMDRYKIIQTNYDTCALKNNRVYKQQEFAPEQLPEIPEEKAVITPIEPKDIKKKLEDERNFEGFLSPEILAIKSEFLNFVSMKMLEVENSLKNANNVKNKLYADAYVNYLLDLESQSGDKKFEIPQHLKSKIDKFKKNGGGQAYLFTKKNIEETSASCAKMIQEVKNALTNEKEEDEALRRQYPSQWNRPYSEQVNQEYVFKLRDLEQKFFIAQNTDKDVAKKFDQYQQWMQKFSQPDDVILQEIPRNSDTEFVAKNHNKLSEISNINRRIMDLLDIERQRANLHAMMEEFMKTDFLPSFNAINGNQVDKQAEFDKMLAPFQTKLAQVEAQIGETYPLLDTISNQAKEINSTRSQSNQSSVKILEEMSLGITVINDIFNDFQQGLTFYGNLTFHLNTLNKVVGDFCLARSIEKSALLQELQAQNAYTGNFNANKPTDVPQTFFNEDSMQFPQGRSEFSSGPPKGGPTQTQMYKPPQQPQGGYPQQGGYGQGPTQTQMYNPGQQQGPVQSQMGYNPGQQGPTQTQMYNPGNRPPGPTQTQMYNPGQQQGPVQSQMGYHPGQQQGPTQTQMYKPPQQPQGGYGQPQGGYGQTQTQMGYNPGQQQQGGYGGYGGNVTSQMGYMPLGQPDGGQGQGGQFGAFGNVVESTFIPGPNNNPNQQGGNPWAKKY